jgi:leucyl-tRNA synthetase
MKYRIAYEGYAEVNWCPELGTVLANDEIVTAPDGTMVSERGEHPVIRKSMRQWFMRISAYAERLLAGLDTIDWPHSIKEIQRNWIGKSEGSEIDFAIDGRDEKITVFTTRADTLFGVTYVVLAPEHEMVQSLAPSIKNWDEVEKYIASVKSLGEDDRTNDKNEKTGICLEGVYAINPANGEKVPVWIANYVLASYGTGMVMAVPAHDERDFEFAKKYNLSIRPVILNAGSVACYWDESKSEWNIQKYGDEWNNHYSFYGSLVNSQQFNGLTSEEAKKKITEFVDGRLVTKYKLRDAIFARQRYWGEPIPLRHMSDGTISALPEKELPLMLPEIEDFAPAGDGNSALSKSKEWMEKGYETNTMPGWAGSSWYFLRYMDPKNSEKFASQEAVNYWGQVDMYVGGAEHATGHLLYSRFWNMALHDLGYVPFAEPFKALRNQGMIAGPDGRKMSKRWGNVINPDDIVARLGADTLRVYESFMGPFESHLPWSTDAIAGSRRFLERVYRLIENGKVGENTDGVLEKVLHKTVKKVTNDIQTFSFNTAISAMMILLNEIEKSESISRADMQSFLKLLAPFAPHITEELWCSLGETESIHLAPWPKFDESKTLDSEVTIAIQINGKVRGSVVVSHDESEECIKEKVFALPQIVKYIEGREIKKVVYIAHKIISFVI